MAKGSRDEAVEEPDRAGEGRPWVGAGPAGGDGSASADSVAAWKARTRVFELFRARFGAAQRILDVGASSESASPEANFLERLLPDKRRITAVGTEDASFLERLYPGLTFRRIEADRPLPFAEGEFDVAFSHAVIGHVVDPAARERFVLELLRVAKAAFFTTPSPRFPSEPHTKVPLLHGIAPSLFYSLLDRGLFHPFYRSSNLRLMTAADLRSLMDRLPGVVYGLQVVRLAGLPAIQVVVAARTDRPGGS